LQKPSLKPSMSAKKVAFSPGDLVFAKVKGFPAWPARVQGRQPSGKYGIFFYGTYETASLKASEIWPFNEDNASKFATENQLKRKGYSEGMEQIRNTPEIAPVLGDLEDLPSPAAKSRSSPSTPVVLKKPVKMLDGSPIIPPKKGVKRDAPDEGEESQSKRSNTEDESTSSPSTVSRSGRVIRPKKFVDDVGSGVDEEASKVADKIIEEPRKVWVKLVASGDLVEINLDRDKPARWENGQQKLQWELATARNALKFKKQVEGGLCVPEEVRKKLEEKTQLSKEEEEVLRQAAELAKRKKKLHWLKTEQQMVDLHLAIRTSLSSSNPLIPRCISHLTALIALPMQPLMLKKQPEIVDTARSLRKYVGPSDQSGYSAAERSEIARGVKQVRERANTLLTRLQSIFPNYSTTTGDFSEFFQEEVSLFHEATKGWAEEKVLSMTVDPLAIEA